MHKQKYPVRENSHVKAFLSVCGIITIIIITNIRNLWQRRQGITLRGFFLGLVTLLGLSTFITVFIRRTRRRNDGVCCVV